jgi:hypothetical protein
MPTNIIDAHGQVAWSWHPDADAAVMRKHHAQTVAKKPGAPGRTRSSRSNYRAGNAGMSRLNLWYLPPAFFSQAGHGCGQRPAFPVPSVQEGDELAKLGRAKRAAGSAALAPSRGTS